MKPELQRITKDKNRYLNNTKETKRAECALKEITNKFLESAVIKD
ncbi:11510_t:CDS:2 [Gigaspora margarita]|uniref:11510_t:CDS:1 n=1 Tax=Gigaspora margarita TaxID=4874 RepID=A0ABN7UM92_GIGMA|nr:11510_t:CDS:2 [Gigaspora margarita]